MGMGQSCMFLQVVVTPKAFLVARVATQLAGKLE